MIYIGSDHGGFELKQRILEYLKNRGYQIVDVGDHSPASSDYPLIAEKVARRVAEDPNNRGVLLCRTGAGVCIVANKINGIMASACWSKEQAEKVRGDENTNVLCLAADYTDPAVAEKVVQAFLDTSVSGDERHKRRREQLLEIEKKH